MPCFSSEEDQKNGGVATMLATSHCIMSNWSNYDWNNCGRCKEMIFHMINNNRIVLNIIFWLSCSISTNMDQQVTKAVEFMLLNPNWLVPESTHNTIFLFSFYTMLQEKSGIKKFWSSERQTVAQKS